ESPFLFGPISIPTLVAIRSFPRLPVRLSQLPRMVSDSPPLFPGTQVEYISAVSIKLNPDATNASSSWNDVDSSTVHPNTFPPKASGATSSPERPSLRFFMISLRCCISLSHRTGHSLQEKTEKPLGMDVYSHFCVRAER